MSGDLVSELNSYKRAIQTHLEAGVVPFWENRSLDEVHGGFLTNYGRDGNSRGTLQKYLTSQCRLIWWFSALTRRSPAQPAFKRLAGQGVSFLLAHFWDEAQGGWHWKVDAGGSLLDAGKVVYGHSFAIYALSEYALATGDARSLEYAARTFDLLQVHCADTLWGGYLENFEPDWQLSPPGPPGGDRKTLDSHMHLMEALTSLYAASGQPVHRRKLVDLIELIVTHMIDAASGSGRNQFSRAWRPVPAIAIDRTWNAERGGKRALAPTDTTSYGHNIELAWLLRRALEVAEVDVTPYRAALRRLAEHTLEHGVDWEQGGVYRDGTASGRVLVDDKEWWQQAEALVGLLDAYAVYGEEPYWRAFVNVWEFVSKKMIDPDHGEWYTLLDRRGRILVSDLGSPWKVAYHTGRSLIECVARLDQLEKRLDPLRSSVV